MYGPTVPMRQDEGAAFSRCPHCAERPAAGHHLCPLNLEADGCELTLFPDGRAIIKGTSEEAVARSLYARYVGT